MMNLSAPDADTATDAMIPSAAQNDAIVAPANSVSGAKASGASSAPSNFPALTNPDIVGSVFRSIFPSPSPAGAKTPMASPFDVSPTTKAYNENKPVLGTAVANGIVGAGSAGMDVKNLITRGIASLLTQPLKSSVDDTKLGAKFLYDNLTGTDPTQMGSAASSVAVPSGGVAAPAAQGESTPASPQPTSSNPSSTPPKPIIDPAAIIKAQVAANPPPGANTPQAPQTDSMGYPDAPGDVSGQTYQEAQPVGAQTWRDLPLATQQQLLRDHPGVNMAEVFNQVSLQGQSNPLLATNNPETAINMARFGIAPSSGSTVDMTPAIASQARYFGGFYGNGQGVGGQIGGNVLRDPQGIAYGMWMPVPNPTTGAIEMKQVEIPKEARATNQAGLSQGGLEDIGSIAKDFYSQELPKTFYGQIAPKYQSIVNLLDTAKKTGDYNNFRSMDVINSYAGITRPGSVVRDSTIATDLEGSGLPNEVARHWEAFVKGQGILSPKDLRQIQDAATDSYNGYKKQVESAKLPALIQAHLRTGMEPKTLNQIMFPQESDSNSPAEGNLPDLQSAKQWLQANPNDPRAAAVAQKIQQMGG